MDKKIMLAVDEEEFNNIKELINEHICDGCEESYSGEYSRGVPCNNGEICLQNLFNGKAKADAEAYLEEVKKEYEECIYDLVFAYVNKDEDMPHKFESQALIDAIKLSVKAKEFLDDDYLVQEFAIGEK